MLIHPRMSLTRVLTCMFVHTVSDAVNVVGLVVGLTIAGIVLFIALPIIICIIVWCCVVGAAAQSRRGGRTYVTTAAPTTSATVVATSQQSAAAPPAAYPAGGYNYPKQVCAMCVSLQACVCVCVCVCVCIFVSMCLSRLLE